MVSSCKRFENKSFLAMSLLLAFILSLFSFGITASAVSEEQAKQNLTTFVYGKMSQTEYSLKEGRKY